MLEIKNNNTYIYKHTRINGNAKFKLMWAMNLNGTRSSAYIYIHMCLLHASMPLCIIEINKEKSVRSEIFLH